MANGTIPSNLGQLTSIPLFFDDSLDKGVADVVVVAKASLLFVDTSPLWMEKFIATLKRHNVLVADTMEHKDYALRKPEDEAAFGA